LKKFIATLLIATSLFVTSAQAAIRITLDPGGSLGEYIEKYYEAKKVGARFVIDGLCISACTLITGIIPRKNVCTTERGQLAFHSASSVGPFGRMHSKEGTRLLGAVYPKDVRKLLLDRGWDVMAGDEHYDLIYVDAATFYKPCPPEHDFEGKITPVNQKEPHDRG
jgi:hypothetical protein